MISQIFASTIIMSVVCYFLAMGDYRLIARDIEVTTLRKHKRAFWVFLITFFVSFYAADFVGKVSVFIFLWTYMMGAYWLFFDLALNKFRNKPTFYISDNGQDHNDAWSDKLFHGIKKGGKLQFVVKCIILLTAAFFYLK